VPAERGVIVGIGVDVCEVARIDQALRAGSGARFRARVFTDAEVASCEGRGRARMESYAASFAAKEAALKALGTGWAGGLAWHEVEVVREAGGRPRLALHGAAATRARRLGVASAHLTLSHTGELAVAMVVLEAGAVSRRTPGRAAAGVARSTRPRSRRRSR
jgi:holo-[acyl-carrier protein] synthase